MEDSPPNGVSDHPSITDESNKDDSNKDGSNKIVTESFFSETVVSIYVESDDKYSNNEVSIKTKVPEEQSSDNDLSNKNDISNNGVSNENGFSNISNKSDDSNKNGSLDDNSSMKTEVSEDRSSNSFSLNLESSSSNDEVESDEWILSQFQMFNLNMEAKRWQTVSHADVKMTLKKKTNFELDFFLIYGVDSKVPDSEESIFNLDLESVPISAVFGEKEVFMRWGPTPPGFNSFNSFKFQLIEVSSINILYHFLAIEI